MDGVLVNFLSGAIEAINKEFNRDVTPEQYALEFGKWETYDYFGISKEEFWNAIELVPNFWINLKPIPWYKELYDRLSGIGEVTIVTSPSTDPECVKEKLIWLRKYLGINSEKVFLGSRKYLFAGNGILIDDYHANINSFTKLGGEAILVPSVWNTPSLTFDMVWNQIEAYIYGMRGHRAYYTWGSNKYAPSMTCDTSMYEGIDIIIGGKNFGKQLITKRS